MTKTYCLQDIEAALQNCFVPTYCLDGFMFYLDVHAATRKAEAARAMTTGGEILTNLIEEIGPEKTKLLLSQRGGEEVYIPGPNHLTPDHWLSIIIGFDAAMKVAHFYQREKITLPLGPESGNRNALQAAVRESAAAGVSVNQIVRETGLHARTVRRIKNRRVARAGFGGHQRFIDPRQGNLFDEDFQCHDEEAPTRHA